jgi:Tfp pilus assembly protein PilN
MLRTNLSTRPFYNERGVHLMLVFGALVVIVLTIFNLSQIVILTRTQSSLSGQADADETRARELRAHAASVRQSIDPKLLDTVAGAAREANVLIGQRLFSWTDLLNRLETTLPEDVRITAMRPNVERDGSVAVTITVVGRRFEDIDQFMQNLEKDGAFSGVFTREELPSEDGLREATIEGRYLVK